jgi:RNA recognition motif-containing protein
MGTNLYVGNLPYEMTEAQLRELFSQAGTVKSVTILLERGTNVPRGFGFVEMGTVGEALKAMRVFNGQEVGGHKIRVNEARPRDIGNAFGRGFDRGHGHRGGAS